MINIDKIRQEATITCDECGTEIIEWTDDFYDVIQRLKENGWSNRKENDEWKNICSDCR